jgi:hypothetical protein
MCRWQGRGSSGTDWQGSCEAARWGPHTWRLTTSNMIVCAKTGRLVNLFITFFLCSKDVNFLWVMDDMCWKCCLAKEGDTGSLIF